MALSNTSCSGSTGRRSCVEAALAQFLQTHGIEDAHTVGIDDIVLEYVISILEDVGTSTAENIDQDGFVEMMDAYYSGFAKKPAVEVFEWMFSLSSQLENSEPKSPVPSAEGCGFPTSPKINEDRVSSSEMGILSEMFPSLCRTDIRRCLRASDGDIDKTIDSLVSRYQNTDLDDIKHRKETTRELLSCSQEKTLRDEMLKKYAFEAERDKNIEYKPVIPKEEPKKLVRYLDGRVVNTRGERFTEVKKEESEDFKKTYINLKPARKYRFH